MEKCCAIDTEGVNTQCIEDAAVADSLEFSRTIAPLFQIRQFIFNI